MTIRMRDDILANQITYYNGLIAKHKQNVEIYLNNPVGIGEHPDVMAAIESEINAIALFCILCNRGRDAETRR